MPYSKLSLTTISSAPSAQLGRKARSAHSSSPAAVPLARPAPVELGKGTASSALSYITRATIVTPAQVAPAAPPVMISPLLDALAKESAKEGVHDGAIPVTPTETGVGLRVNVEQLEQPEGDAHTSTFHTFLNSPVYEEHEHAHQTTFNWNMAAAAQPQPSHTYLYDKCLICHDGFQTTEDTVVGCSLHHHFHKECLWYSLQQISTDCYEHGYCCPICEVGNNQMSHSVITRMLVFVYEKLHRTVLLPLSPGESPMEMLKAEATIDDTNPGGIVVQKTPTNTNSMIRRMYRMFKGGMIPSSETVEWLVKQQLLDTALLLVKLFTIVPTHAMVSMAYHHREDVYQRLCQLPHVCPVLSSVSLHYSILKFEPGETARKIQQMLDRFIVSPKQDTLLKCVEILCTAKTNIQEWCQIIVMIVEAGAPVGGSYAEAVLGDLEMLANGLNSTQYNEATMIDEVCGVIRHYSRPTATVFNRLLRKYILSVQLLSSYKDYGLYRQLSEGNHYYFYRNLLDMVKRGGVKPNTMTFEMVFYPNVPLEVQQAVLGVFAGLEDRPQVPVVTTTGTSI